MRSAEGDDVIDGGDSSLRGSSDRRTGYIRGINAFGIKQVRYSAVGGPALFEGDILLGTTEKMETAKAAYDAWLAADAQSTDFLADRNAYLESIIGRRHLWPNGVVPYQ